LEHLYALPGDGSILEGMKMKHPFHFDTQSGVVSKEAAAQIRMLINDLARTVNALDASDIDDLPRQMRRWIWILAGTIS